MNNKTDILNELKEKASVLASMKKKATPLTVPENYFSTSANVLMEKLAEEDLLLNTIPKNINTVPEGYFTQFPDKVFANINEDVKLNSEGKFIPLVAAKKTAGSIHFSRLAIAAMIVGIAVVSILFLIKPTETADTCTDGIACLTQKEIYEYMYQNSHDFGIRQVEIVASTAFADSSFSADLEISEEAVTQYLEQDLHALEWDDASSDIF